LITIMAHGQRNQGGCEIILAQGARNMFPKIGNKLPNGEREAAYASAISRALMADVGAGHVATKTVMLWTGASERSARHWLNGDYGPGGRHLILLARNSAAVTRTILQLAGRGSMELSLEISAARAALVRATAIIDALGPGSGID
jgi:hypothetical protein